MFIDNRRQEVRWHVSSFKELKIWLRSLGEFGHQGIEENFCIVMWDRNKTIKREEKVRVLISELQTEKECPGNLEKSWGRSSWTRNNSTHYLIQSFPNNGMGLQGTEENLMKVMGCEIAVYPQTCTQNKRFGVWVHGLYILNLTQLPLPWIMSCHRCLTFVSPPVECKYL